MGGARALLSLAYNWFTEGFETQTEKARTLLDDFLKNEFVGVVPRAPSDAANAETRVTRDRRPSVGISLIL